MTHRGALGKRSEQEAGRERLPVDERGARPADPDPARLANGQDPEVAAQDGEQALGGERVGFHLGPVQGELDPHRSCLPRALTPSTPLNGSTCVRPSTRT